LETTPRELGSLLAARISRSTELLIKPSRCRFCGGYLRSPHALDGDMVELVAKSKKLLQCSNYLSRSAA
jgi:hypothetical protein